MSSVLEYESTVTYRLGSLVVKRPSSDRVVPGSNPGPLIFKESGSPRLDQHNNAHPTIQGTRVDPKKPEEC